MHCAFSTFCPDLLQHLMFTLKIESISVKRRGTNCDKVLVNN